MPQLSVAFKILLKQSLPIEKFLALASYDSSFKRVPTESRTCWCVGSGKMISLSFKTGADKQVRHRRCRETFPLISWRDLMLTLSCSSSTGFEDTPKEAPRSRLDGSTRF